MDDEKVCLKSVDITAGKCLITGEPRGVPMSIYGILLTVFLVILTACSAGDNKDSIVSKTFRGSRLLEGGVTRIYIDQICDEIIDESLCEALARTLMNRANNSRKLSAVESPENSDLTVKVEVMVFTSTPVKYNTSGTVERIKLRVESRVTVFSSAAKEKKINRKKVEAELYYSALTSPPVSEYRAVADLTGILSDRIVSVIISGWYEEDSGRQ